MAHRPREVVENAMAHVMGDKAEQAYRRSDALEKRRKLMEAWAGYSTHREVGGRKESTAPRSTRTAGGVRNAPKGWILSGAESAQEPDRYGDDSSANP
jgi:hypothetical protein